MAPSYMFDRLLNTPLVSSLVFNLRGQFVKQDYLRPCYKHIFLGHPGNKNFLHADCAKNRSIIFFGLFFCRSVIPPSSILSKSFFFQQQNGVEETVICFIKIQSEGMKMNINFSYFVWFAIFSFVIALRFCK